MKLRILFILGLFPLVLCSQTYEIKGSVRDTDGVPLPLATVLLLRTQDSVQVKGTSADDAGRFSLTGVAPGLYFFDAQDKLLELRQGELTEAQISAALLR